MKLLQTLSLALMATCLATLPAKAQNAEHEQWIRASTREGLALFTASGAAALQKSIETCYSAADRKPDFNTFFREAERCSAQDHLGLILFVAHQRMLEKSGQSLDDPFFNPAAQQNRLNSFWANRSLNNEERQKLIERIFSIVYDEFTKAMPRTDRPATPSTP